MKQRERENMAGGHTAKNHRQLPGNGASSGSPRGGRPRRGQRKKISSPVAAAARAVARSGHGSGCGRGPGRSGADDAVGKARANGGRRPRSAATDAAERLLDGHRDLLDLALAHGRREAAEPSRGSVRPRRGARGRAAPCASAAWSTSR